MIYIDPPMWPAHNTLFSHLVSDASLAELHAFCAAAGISRRAFDADHYDVPAQRYADLISRGAVPVDGGRLVRILIASGLRIPARERPSALNRPLTWRWTALAPRAPRLGRRLLECWNEPHRRYHDPRHLLQVLEALDALTGRRVPQPVALAAWFHDAVHDGVAGADEQASARLAEELLPSAGFGAAVTAETARLVRLTAHHRPDDADRRGALLTDADLAVLARPPARYRAYLRDVRSEYPHLTDAQFRDGRRKVVSALLEADRLYRTDTGHQTWEAAARRNLAAEQAGEFGSCMELEPAAPHGDAGAPSGLPR